MQVSALGNNNEGHNNEQEHNTDEFPNIGSIRRNVRLPFLFDYNQKKPGKYFEKDSELEALSEISNKRK